MKSGQLTLAVWLLALLGMLLVALSNGQSRFPVPPAPADKETTTRDSKPALHPQRVDTVQLQREARELSELAQTIPVDMQHINQGLLPKDTVEKLKRIEKLSKRLRGELNP
jgi:hypothetical protein